MTDTANELDEPRTIPKVLERAARRFGDQEALVEGDLRLSYIELAQRADEVARALIASGIERGDRIAIWAPNSATWVIAALGIHRAGAAIVTMNTRFKGSEGAYLLQKSGARMLLTVTDFLDTNYIQLLDEAGKPDTLEEIVVLSGDATSDSTTWADLLQRADKTTSEQSAERANEIKADDLSDLLFTSGTTGKPKGAMLLHGPSVKAYTAWSDVVGLREGDRYLIINPFFHTFGLKA